MGEFPHCYRFSGHLFNVFSVEIDTFITNTDITWSCCKAVDLILAFPAEGTPWDSAVLWLTIFLHRSVFLSGFDHAKLRRAVSPFI